MAEAQPVALYLQDAHPLRQAMGYARHAESRGFTAVWQAESRLVREATVPLAEVLSYATQLKSMTGGQGSFTMEFKTYEPVPPNVQQNIVQAYLKSRGQVEEE